MYRHDELNKPTKDGPLSYVLHHLPQFNIQLELGPPLSGLSGLNGFIWQTKSVMFYLTGCVLALLDAVDRKMEFISRLVRTGLVN